MGLLELNLSDYGSGKSSNSRFPWSVMDRYGRSIWGPTSCSPAESVAPRAEVQLGRAASFVQIDMGKQRNKIDEALLDFQLNGCDSPHDPEEEQLWSSRSAIIPGPLSGMGPAGGYLRQKSWPEPECSPAVPLSYVRPTELDRSPAVRPTELDRSPTVRPTELDRSPAVRPTELDRSPAVRPTELDCSPAVRPTELDRSPAVRPTGPDVWGDFAPSASSQWNSQLSFTAPASPPQSDVITAEQWRVLKELPDIVLHSLLRDLQVELDNHVAKSCKGKRLPVECRFCKNNGEREVYYGSHTLKDAVGRVSCPVLRAFVCKRCGAHGDTAHTIKYCPLSTYEERIHSTAMMRSVRVQSGRKRMRFTSLATSVNSQVDQLAYMLEAPSSGDRHNFLEEPLDPLWAALEQKLMI